MRLSTAAGAHRARRPAITTATNHHTTMSDQEKIERLLGAINWAMGCNGMFQRHPSEKAPYWWRTELAARAGIEYDAELGSYVLNADEQLLFSQVPTGNGEPELYQDQHRRAYWANRKPVLAAECSTSPQNLAAARKRLGLDDGDSIDLDLVGTIVRANGLAVRL